MAAGSATNEWRGLLEETRSALSNLCVEDLQRLAARAECMLAATLGPDSVRQKLPRPQAREMLEISRQHSLLRDLLSATDKNLAVLRRLRGRAGDLSCVGEVNSRWVR
jgi:hypothetical protein